MAGNHKNNRSISILSNFAEVFERPVYENQSLKFDSASLLLNKPKDYEVFLTELS